MFRNYINLLFYSEDITFKNLILNKFFVCYKFILFIRLTKTRTVSMVKIVFSLIFLTDKKAFPTLSFSFGPSKLYISFFLQTHLLKEITLSPFCYGYTRITHYFLLFHLLPPNCVRNGKTDTLLIDHLFISCHASNASSFLRHQLWFPSTRPYKTSLLLIPSYW